MLADAVAMRSLDVLDGRGARPAGCAERFAPERGPLRILFRATGDSGYIQ